MKDLSGDGKITQKDVLMGRGVIPMKKAKGGGLSMDIQKIRKMQEGGIPIEDSTKERPFKFMDEATRTERTGGAGSRFQGVPQQNLMNRKQIKQNLRRNRAVNNPPKPKPKT